MQLTANSNRILFPLPQVFVQFDHSDQFSPSGSWQGWLLQGWPSKCGPGQYAPPFLGAGLVQDLYFFCFPTPHILSQGPAMVDQGLQAPPTGTGDLDTDMGTTHHVLMLPTHQNDVLSSA